MSGSMGGQQASPQQQDASITALLLAVGEDMMQPIASGSLTPNGSNNTINVPMRQVGLTRGFLVHIQASFQNVGTGTATLTPYGGSNILSNITLTDLDNYQRINTTGWGLHMLNTAKEGFPFGAAMTYADFTTDGTHAYPVKWGTNFLFQYATPSMAAGNETPTTATVDMWFWVPCAYGKRDLRGAIYTGVVNATAFLQFTVSPINTAAVASGDATLAVYSGADTTVTYTGCNYTVYQGYIDQIPRYATGPNAGAPILPPVSMRTQYRIVNTALSAINMNQDFPIPFSNFQSFLSTMFIYDQNGTLAGGTDVNQWKIAAANTLQFKYLDPFAQTLGTRVMTMVDPPVGGYMFNFRDQPINTNQAGNIQILLNPSSAASGSQLLVQWESFAEVNSVLGAQSLPAS